MAPIKAYLERDDLILIPVDATEQHGAHAAMMLDTASNHSFMPESPFVY